MGSETILFIGAHYEMKGSETTKYYFAGATRIAMRKYTIPQSMSVEYFLSDHLGSTSITTDADGNKISEMHYNPWGEVRYAWTATQSTTPAYEMTKFTFTGQYSYMDDITTQNVTEGFGLMHYNARMYDPALGRFTSADTIIPSHQGVQGWDRFAYVNNNPVRYTDPSGHGVDCGLGESCVIDPYTKPISTGNTVKPPASQNPPLGGDNQVDDDLCKRFGECENTSSLDDLVNGKGPGLNMPSQNNNSCWDDFWECYMQGWNNAKSAWKTIAAPGTPAIAEIYAITYLAGWGGAHLGLAMGTVGLACAAFVAGCATATVASPVLIQGFARGGPEWHVGLETVKNMNIIHVDRHATYGVHIAFGSVRPFVANLHIYIEKSFPFYRKWKP
jgi:RHS repeat-associated protein